MNAFTTTRFLMMTMLFMASQANATRTISQWLFGTKSSKKMEKLSLQELQSPPGPRHSNGIIFAPESGTTADGSAAGFVTFANELVVPGTGGFNGGKSAGTQTGHCVQVWDQTQLACYFNFHLKDGRILAEALFDLVNFPNAELVITGGSGKYLGIVGTAKTRAPEDFNGTTFFYDFEYMILG